MHNYERNAAEARTKAIQKRMFQPIAVLCGVAILFIIGAAAGSTSAAIVAVCITFFLIPAVIGWIWYVAVDEYVKKQQRKNAAARYVQNRSSMIR